MNTPAVRLPATVTAGADFPATTGRRFHISDTHFFHKNIIRFCDRPYEDVKHMSWDMVNKWNSVVSPEDTVIHYGDVALGDYTLWDDLLTALNGTIHLIVGNHERIFKAEKPSRIDRFMGDHERWFASIHDNVAGFTLEDGTVVNMSHFPYEADHMDKARHMEYRLPDDGTILIHGHTHLDSKVSRSEKGTLQIHVGADAWDYTPVAESDLIDLINANR